MVAVELCSFLLWISVLSDLSFKLNDRDQGKKVGGRVGKGGGGVSSDDEYYTDARWRWWCK